MKRILAAVGMLVLLLQTPALADTSRSSVLIEAQTGRVLYEHNAHEPLPMASTTKVMTALLALERCSMNEQVTAGKNAFGVPGTSIYLSEGETLSMEDMLYGLMISSGNDAAVAIAEHIAGSVDAFCELMTARAEEIGCENTVFTTPHGLPSQHHHTTAWDMALIAREAMQNQTFRRIVGTQRKQIPWANHDYERVLNNKNRLLSTYEGATGIKTGYTSKAGRCLVFSAKRDGMELIGVVLNCADWFDQAARILDAGFEKYEWVVLHDAGEKVAEAEIIGGVKGSVSICAQYDLAAPMEKGRLPRIEIQLPEKIAADVHRGDTVGSAMLYDEDELICTVPLIAMEDVPRADFRHYFRRVLEGWQAVSP